MNNTAIVIGAGIVGIAVARSLVMRGYKVTVLERNDVATGASIRNFGMIWPVGQPDGQLYERALVSKSIWKSIAREAGIWTEENGSLHLAYCGLEATVMQEILAGNKRELEWLSPADVLKKSPAVNPANLVGGLYSPDEMVIESRVAMQQLPVFLQEQHQVNFSWNTTALHIEGNCVHTTAGRLQADKIYVCSGPDFETLYPEVFAANHFTRCKLQMMRLAVQPGGFRIGPSLCGALSLIHYAGFASAPSLPMLQRHFGDSMPDYLRWGIHVMISQNAAGELTVGDSHEYGNCHDPFDKAFINQMVLDYCRHFAALPNWQLVQSWNGVYAKRTNKETEFVYPVNDVVTIVNGLGGAGMTLSFGLAEEVINGSYKINQSVPEL